MELDFQTEVLSRLAVIESKLDGYKDIEKTVRETDSKCKKNAEDIQEIQDKIKWLSRTITGALITGTVGIIFILIQMGLGVK